MYSEAERARDRRFFGNCFITVGIGLFGIGLLVLWAFGGSGSGSFSAHFGVGEWLILTAILLIGGPFLFHSGMKLRRKKLTTREEKPQSDVEE